MISKQRWLAEVRGQYFERLKLDFKVSVIMDRGAVESAAQIGRECVRSSEIYQISLGGKPPQECISEASASAVHIRLLVLPSLLVRRVQTFGFFWWGSVVWPRAPIMMSLSAPTTVARTTRFSPLESLGRGWKRSMSGATCVLEWSHQPQTGASLLP